MSVDIKSTYGAVGDGQIATTTCSMTIGTNVLTVTNNLFVGGDIGKLIAIPGAVPIPPDGTNALGTLLTTISSVAAFSVGTQVIHTVDNATVTVSAVSQQIEWGTDDNTPFTNFHNAQQGLSGVVLTVPAGRYCFGLAGQRSNLFTIGITGLTINGTGNPVFTDMMGGGNGIFMGGALNVLFNDNQAEILTQDVNKGATVIPFVTVGDTSKITVNNWYWMTGFDTQGFGFPPNVEYAEYIFVTAVDTIGGTVTVSSPLKNSYKAHWPKWVNGSSGSGPPTYTGGQSSLGGPATIYLVQQTWDAVHVYNGVGWRSTPTLMNANIRDVTLTNCFAEVFSVNVSQQQNCTINNLGSVPTLWELDKGTENFTLRNTTCRGFTISSPSPYNVTLDTVTVTNQMGASTKNWTAANCTFPMQVSFGPASYGTGSLVSISNSSFGGQLIPGGVKETDVAGTGGYSMSNGIITRSKFGGTGSPPQWAIPGQYCFFGSRHNYEHSFKVLDIIDGSTLQIVTDFPGGFPTPVSPATTISIITAPPPDFTFNSCTGCDDATSWSGVPAHLPQFSRWNLTYTGNIGNSAIHTVKVAGKLVSMKFTVNSGYTGGTFNIGGPFVINNTTNADVSWNPTIDLTTPGVRLITPSVPPTPLGADANLTPPNSGNITLTEDQMQATMSGVTGSGSITLEIVADQGISLSTFGDRGFNRWRNR